jgi:hypothetical protein
VIAHVPRIRSASPHRQPKGSRRSTIVGLLAVAAGAALSLTLVTSPAGASAPVAQGSTPGMAAVVATSGSLGNASVLSPAVDRAHSTSGRAVQTHDVDPVCTFNGQSIIVPNVTPGSSIAISCTGWEAFDQVAVVQASPLAFGPNGTSDDLDPNITFLTSDGGGNLSGTFVVPNPFSAPDPNAACPATPAQVTQGYFRCGLILADLDENGSLVALNYASAPPAAGTSAVGMASIPDGRGYWVAWANGAVTVHGDALDCGNASQLHLAQPITHIVSTPDGNGYWLVAADGGTFTFGDAGFFGSMGGKHLNAPVVDIAPTHDGQGYWLVASDGGIFSFGDAVFQGSMGGQHLNQPIVGIAADNATGGYWMVATDGGIFSFGAPFHGSTGSTHLNKPINGMAVTNNGQGYWLVASDGGVFTEGDAQFMGSTGNIALNRPVVGMAADPATGGYWLAASDGGIFSFGAPFFGAG